MIEQTMRELSSPAITPMMFVTLFLTSAIFYEVVKLTIGHLFGRFLSPGFVKIKECEQCSVKSSTIDAEMKNDIRTIKQVLISMATSGSVSEADLKRLVS